MKTGAKIGIIIGAVVTAVLAVVAVIAVVIGVMAYRANHDLQGNYYTTDYFPIDSITFYKNGKVVAMGDGDTYQGRYHKKKGSYIIEFSSADSIISDAQAHMFELKATPKEEGSMYFEVIPISNYYGWLGTVVVFYEDYYADSDADSIPYYDVDYEAEYIPPTIDTGALGDGEANDYVPEMEPEAMATCHNGLKELPKSYLDYNYGELKAMLGHEATFVTGELYEMVAEVYYIDFLCWTDLDENGNRLPLGDDVMSTRVSATLDNIIDMNEYVLTPEGIWAAFENQDEVATVTLEYCANGNPQSFEHVDMSYLLYTITYTNGDVYYLETTYTPGAKGVDVYAGAMAYLYK